MSTIGTIVTKIVKQGAATTFFIVAEIMNHRLHALETLVATHFVNIARYFDVTFVNTTIDVGDLRTSLMRNVMENAMTCETEQLFVYQLGSRVTDFCQFVFTNSNIIGKESTRSAHHSTEQQVVSRS